MHRRLLVSRGSNGRLVIGAPHPLQLQLPSTRFFSPCVDDALEDELPPFAWQLRHLSPAVLLGSNGSSVIAPPHTLHVQFP